MPDIELASHGYATLDEATSRAAAAFPATSMSSAAERASWLEAAASALDFHVAELVELADRETHLGSARLTGEVARSTGQLRLFAAVIRDGAYLDATIDHADPSTTPPRPDLRRMLWPIGPVAVFSASNFPFAFSVAGGDTAAAIAAGCAVIVKAHPGHPRLSQRVFELVDEAVTSAGAPVGTISLVEGVDTGIALVGHPVIKAVSFTGSLRGGRALFDIAAARSDPIPFYGELGSINPVVITPAAVQQRGVELARGLAGSFTMGVGQFCTKPGVVLIPAHTEFTELVRAAVEDASGGRMLTDQMASAFSRGVAELADDVGVHRVAGALSDGGDGTAQPVLFLTTTARVLEAPGDLLAEHFGPATLLVEYDTQAEAVAVLATVEGALTTTLHAELGDDLTELLSAAIGISGRVLFEGWPTGVAVVWSQNHGGPWPATTSSGHTSVGASSIDRFLRPVAFQSAPSRILPRALAESNPLGIVRRVDGELHV